MIQFNELRIDSNKHLIIDAQVTSNDASVYIDKLYIGFGSNTDLFNLLDSDFAIFNPILTPSENPRRVYFDIDLLDPTVSEIFNCAEPSRMLIYIRVDIMGSTEFIASLPCSSSTSFEGYVYDQCLLTQKVFDFLKGIDDPCNNISNLANYIVKVKGIEIAVESGRFNLANKYWNTFFNNRASNNSVYNFNCGCRNA